jgi:hypothetical protein
MVVVNTVAWLIKFKETLNYDFVAEFVGSNSISSVKWFPNFVLYPQFGTGCTTQYGTIPSYKVSL